MFLLSAKWWVKLFNWNGKECVTLHHGIKPATPLAGPFNTEKEAKEAKEAKAGIFKSGKIETFLKSRRAKVKIPAKDRKSDNLKNGAK